MATSGKNKQELISVIVPVYNGHDYLRECVESVLAQTYKNLEVILVDDASTDDSLAIANDLARKDSRIKVLHRSKNGGQSAARNDGVDVAKGDWIAFIDNDDTYEPEFLGVCLTNAHKHNVKISGTANWRIEPEQKFVADIHGKPSGKYSAEELIIKILYRPAFNWNEVWSKIYHKSLKGQLVFPAGSQLEDFRVILPLFYNVGEAYFDSRPLYNWIIRKSSQSDKLFFDNKFTYYAGAEWLRNWFIQQNAPQQYIDAAYDFEYGLKCRLLEDMVKTHKKENIQKAKEYLPTVKDLHKHVKRNDKFTLKSDIHCWLRLLHVKLA